MSDSDEHLFVMPRLGYELRGDAQVILDNLTGSRQVKFFTTWGKLPDRLQADLLAMRDGTQTPQDFGYITIHADSAQVRFVEPGAAPDLRTEAILACRNLLYGDGREALMWAVMGRQPDDPDQSTRMRHVSGQEFLLTVDEVINT